MAASPTIAATGTTGIVLLGNQIVGEAKWGRVTRLRITVTDYGDRTEYEITVTEITVTVH
jgi:hypothetical protein